MNVLLIDGHIVFSTMYRMMKMKGDVKPLDFFNTCLNSVMKSVKYHQPTHVLFCMDDYSRSWRREIVPGYRGDRFQIPSSFLPYFSKFLRSLSEKGIMAKKSSSNESYDIISTFTKKLKSAKPDAVINIFGSDERLNSLISDGVSLYYPYAQNSKDIIRDKDWLKESYDVSPESWHLLMSLCGQSKKGVPGIPGIGFKTAVKLSKEYSTIQSIYEERNAIQGASGNKIRDYIESVISSTAKVLMLRADLELGIKLNEIKYR